MTAPTILVNGELTIPMGDRTLVASKSEPNSWHVVTGNPATCDCPSFFHRWTCRHLALAAEAERMARILAEQQRPCVVTACPEPGNRLHGCPDKKIVDMTTDEYSSWLTEANRWAKERHIPTPR